MSEEDQGISLPEGADKSRLEISTGERQRLLREADRAGCVIRALESAFGVAATEDERVLQARAREEVLRKTPNPFRPGRSSSEMTALIRLTKHRDLESTRQLMEWSCRQQTPLGKAMGEYTGEFTLKRGDELRRMIEEGKVVLVDITTVDGKAHLAHAGIRDGRTVSLSDNNVDMPLFQERSYYSFVFTPRGKPEESS